MVVLLHNYQIKTINDWIATVGLNTAGAAIGVGATQVAINTETETGLLI